MKLIVFGSTGLVGSEFIKILKRKETPKYNVEFFSGHSDMIAYKGEIYNVYTTDVFYKDLEKGRYTDDDICVNCASEDVSIRFLEITRNMKVYPKFVDNSSYFRRNPDIPLIIPHINFRKNDMEGAYYRNIYANPNCSTIITCMFLDIIKHLKPENIQVSTYQAISGGGYKKLGKLFDDTRKVLSYDGEKFEGVSGKVKDTDEPVKEQIGFNFYPHESEIDKTNNYNGEELKMYYETLKILKLETFPTCIRVPVVRCHGITITFRFDKEYSRDELIELINEKEYVNYTESPDALSCEGKYDISVGHLRCFPPNEKNIGKQWSVFVVGDQLLTGAAENAYKIVVKLS